MGRKKKWTENQIKYIVYKWMEENDVRKAKVIKLWAASMKYISWLSLKYTKIKSAK